MKWTYKFDDDEDWEDDEDLEDEEEDMDSDEWVFLSWIFFISNMDLTIVAYYGFK